MPPTPVKNGMLCSENAIIKFMRLTISVTGKKPRFCENPLGTSLKKKFKFIFALIPIQREHYGVRYDANISIYPQNRVRCTL